MFMDLPKDSEHKKQFVTNVGLITTRGKEGDNIMSAEWTHMHSYSPGVISVSIGNEKLSQHNIKKSKEFGVSLAAYDQNIISSIAGGSHGEDIDKIAALRDLGYGFFEGKKTRVILVKGAAMNAECKLIKKIKLGTHTTFIGEVVEVHPVSGKEPLIYKGGKYWRFGEQIKKPSEEELNRIDNIVERHKK
jgi:flavin reductase (DIM6/NTAB) family NADH-FMN oxidoreductase RutF